MTENESEAPDECDQVPLPNPSKETNNFDDTKKLSNKQKLKQELNEIDK